MVGYRCFKVTISVQGLFKGVWLFFKVCDCSLNKNITVVVVVFSYIVVLVVFVVLF